MSYNYYLTDELVECIEKLYLVSNLSPIHVNAKSMVNTLEYIELLKTKNNFDASETCENDLNSHFINIPGYRKVSSMRSSGAKGGGTALFVKPNFKFTAIDVFTVSFEPVFIETIDLDQKVKTIIGTIYRPLDTNLSFFNFELEKVIGLFTKSQVNLILLGNYNINLLNHEVHRETADFLNLLYANI